jgi:outer membrane lipoprotein SlyB
VTVSFDGNYVAVIAGAIAGVVIGAVYYGALGFGHR